MSLGPYICVCTQISNGLQGSTLDGPPLRPPPPPPNTTATGGAMCTLLCLSPSFWRVCLHAFRLRFRQSVPILGHCVWCNHANGYRGWMYMIDARHKAGALAVGRIDNRDDEPMIGWVAASRWGHHRRTKISTLRPRHTRRRCRASN